MILATMIIRLFLSVILFRAALHKLRDHKQFQSELNAYQLLPNAMLSIATTLLIGIELITSIGLMNVQWTVAPLFAATLLMVYNIAMIINLMKGRTNIDCGCSGPLISNMAAAKKTISWSLVARNLVLIGLALLCMVPLILIPAINARFGAAEIFVILAGTTVSLLIYETIEQAIANLQNHQRWQAARMLKF